MRKKNIMKTYIVKTDKGFVATMATNKTEAFCKINSANKFGRVYKTSVILSACHINYVACKKWI